MKIVFAICDAEKGNNDKCMAHELYVLFGNARERENFFWKQVRIHEFHLENQ